MATRHWTACHLVSSAGSRQIIEMPGWRPITRQVGTTLVVVSLLPMVVFYTTMSLFGLRAAALAMVGLYYCGLLIKLARRRPILAAALLTAGLLSIRAAVMFLTDSAYLYFLQPVAGTVWLLSTASLGGFIVLKSVLGPALTIVAVVASYLYFRITVRDQNVQVRWAHHQRWVPMPA